MRELLKDNGIGRPSTRANIIETLFRRKYIEKKKKNIFATQTGMDLIDTIQNELLKSPELTGSWERKLRLIEKGEYQMDTFKQELVQMVVDLTQEVKNNTAKTISLVAEKPAPPAKEEKEKPPKRSVEELQCPKCKTQPLKKGNTAYGCSNYAVCGFKIPFEAFGKKLSEKQLTDLLTKGKTGKIKGLKTAGGEVEAKLAMAADFNLVIEA